MDHPVMPTTKRRRLQESATALSKPFRSPLRISTQNKQEASPTTECKPQSAKRCKNSATSSQFEPVSQVKATSREHIAYVSSQPVRPPIKGPEKVQIFPFGGEAPATVEKEHSSLHQQLSKLRQDLDTVQQAEKIASSNQHVELEKLIQKWKFASRELAEEVFRTARDRVNQMGGVGAWRERNQRPSGWNDEEEILREGLTNEQREAIDNAKDEAAREGVKYGIKSPMHEDNEEEDESLTMNMMLRSLNIDLQLIGYDKENQRWTD